MQFLIKARSFYKARTNIEQNACKWEGVLDFNVF